MYYEGLRYLIWIIISIIIIIKIRKTKIVRKKLIIFLLIGLCAIPISVSTIFPTENLFINFKSPESVFHYTCTGKIERIIYGDESCLIYYASGISTHSQTFIIKSESGYKIAGSYATKKIFNKVDKDGIFEVYNVVGTDDYYICGVVDQIKSTIDVFNGKNQLIKSDMKIIQNSGMFYFFVKDFTNQHYLLIDGKKIVLSK